MTKKTKWTFISDVVDGEDLSHEDGGDVYGEVYFEDADKGDDEYPVLCLRLRSVDERNLPRDKKHKDMRSLIGKKLSITMEVIG